MLAGVVDVDGIARLRADTATLALMRAAAARLARPDAADKVATLLAELAEVAGPPRVRSDEMLLFRTDRG